MLTFTFLNNILKLLLIDSIVRRSRTARTHISALPLTISVYLEQCFLTDTSVKSFVPYNFLLWGDVLWIVGCIAVSLVPTRQMPVAPHPSYNNKDRLQALTNVLWKNKITLKWEPLILRKLTKFSVTCSLISKLKLIIVPIHWANVSFK